MAAERSTGGGRGRRAPRAGERQRDAERTRERILEAAVAEFGDKGFAGARVGTIAERAGVNVQLISYYFGGKAGLYHALTARWQNVAAEVSDAGSLGAVVAGFARTSLEQRDWTRLLVWDGLTEPPPVADGSGAADDDGPDFLAVAVEDLRQRQRDGELPAGIHPAHLLLVLFAASCAPVVLPHIARRLGIDPTSTEFAQTYPDELGALVELLSAPVAEDKNSGRP